jgi:dephospho-CoA kinase
MTAPKKKPPTNPDRMKAAVLTGGAAVGKTTLLNALARQGISTFNADEAARTARECPLSIQEAREALGVELSDREAVKRLISGSDEARRRLNSILHPRIWQAILESQAQVVEAPLAFEAVIHHRFQEVWTAWCPLPVQIERLKARGGGAERFLALQAPIEAKKALSDLLIRTDRPIEPVIESIAARARHLS